MSVDAIRFYEKPPAPRTGASYGGQLSPVQHPGHSANSIIRSAQRLRFSLPEVRELLVIQREEDETCSHVRDLLRAKVAQIPSKAEELRLLEEQLKKEAAKVRTQAEDAGRFP